MPQKCNFEIPDPSTIKEICLTLKSSDGLATELLSISDNAHSPVLTL